MQDSQLRKYYRKLLMCYPRRYRTRFGESMEQTFNDLLRDRITTGSSVWRFILWTFAETSLGILRENITVMTTQKFIVRPILWALGLLLIPLIAMQLSDEWNWSVSDFVFMGSLIFGIGLAYQLIANAAKTNQYRIAAAIALAGIFILIWVNGAVGIIGDGPINLLYAIVPVVGFIGALIARLRPSGMANTLFAMAFATTLIPIIAVVADTKNFSPGMIAVFGLNAVFVMIFTVSGLLFKRSALTHIV